MFRSALDQLASAAKSSQARQVLEVPIEFIDPDPNQPRKTFERLEELTASIKAIGVKQPLLIRKHPNSPDRYFLVAGERRLRCALKAGLETVPCLLETGEDEEPARLLITQLTENLQRRDMPILETAEALQQALQQTGFAKGELARVLGKKPSFVSKLLGLLKAAGPAREALEEGLLLSPETYRRFSALPETRQRDLLTNARLNQQPIRRSHVATPLKRPDSQPASQTPKRDASSRSSSTSSRFKISLTCSEIRTIISKFGTIPPKKQSELKPTLIQLLQEARTNR